MCVVPWLPRVSPTERLVDRRARRRGICIHVFSVRPVQQGLTKPHPRKPQHARPTMCIPVLPTTAHPRSRKPLKVSKGPLPWEKCYHPTCYDVWMRIPAEPQYYFQSSSAAGNLSLQLMEAFDEDKLHSKLLRTGLDDDRIL